MTTTPIHIAVGIIEDAHSRVLVSRRRPSTHGAGDWEFPGGKVDGGESVYQALARELAEELGIRVSAARPLIRVRHDYPERLVVLDTWRVTAYAGRPESLEGQALRWLEKGELRNWPLMAADAPIVTALRLPDRYLITGASADAPADFLARLDASLERGVMLVRLRAPMLDDVAYRALAARAIGRCHRVGAACLLDRDAGMVADLGADGLHMPARRLAALNARPIGVDHWFAASCHTAAELRHAARLAADFVVLSPVKPTPTHPGTETLGWLVFNELVESANLPVYALGGLDPGDLADAWSHGAQGIAAIRGLWG